MSKEISASYNELFDDLIEAEEKPKDTIGLNAIYNTVQVQYKHKGRINISVPITEKAPYLFRLYGVDWTHTSCFDAVSLNQAGELKEYTPFRSLPTYRKVMMVMTPLHTGEIFGLATIIFYFIISLIGCSLPITGFLIWFKKAKKMR